MIRDFSSSNKWKIMKEELGIPMSESEKLDKLYKQYETEVCVGHRHFDSLLPIFQSELHMEVPQDFSFQKYFIDRFESNDSLWPVVSKLKSSMKVGLLTDMWPNMYSEIKSRNLFPDITWDAIVDSSLVGYRKPMPEIYKIAESSAGVPATEILFVDNNPINITGAKDLGWQTFFYNSKDYTQASSDLALYLQSQGL